MVNRQANHRFIRYTESARVGIGDKTNPKFINENWQKTWENGNGGRYGPEYFYMVSFHS